jgi:hypothetical protein
MDNGPLQREQASKIKKLVGQKNPKRRNRRPSSQLSGTSLQMKIKSEETSRASSTYFNSFPEGPSRVVPGWNMMALGVETQFSTWNMDLSCLDNDISPTPSQDNLFTAESIVNNLGLESNIDNNLSGGNDPMLSGVSEANSTATSNTSNREDGIRGYTYGFPLEGMYPRANNAPGAASSWSSQLTPAQSLSPKKVAKERSPFVIYPTESVLHREMEDKLLMHYLDEVFYIQYPFYNSLYKQSRSWLFSTIRRVRSVYYATLALSQYHIQSTEESFLPPTLSRKIHYYDAALREMELSQGEHSSWSGTTSIVRSMESTTCILQILFFEVRYRCFSLN